MAARRRPGSAAVTREPDERSSGWPLVASLALTETISWGVLYYSFAVFLGPIADGLEVSRVWVSGALTLAVLVSAVAGIPVGRHLDRHGPRDLMTLGSIAGVALVIGWSQVGGLVGLYGAFLGIGLVMGAVLYEPAFVVLAKFFPDPRARRRAMTAMTLFAAISSFVFVPLAQELLDAHGWRDALLILAGVLAVTIPIHASLPSKHLAPSRRPRHAERRAAKAILGRADFRLITVVYFLATVAGLALLVELIPMLTERGFSATFAAFALGTMGLAQIPGRLLFVVIGRWLDEARATLVTISLIGAGLAVLLLADVAALVLLGVLLLGMGNGLAILSRATVLAERFGTATYGAVSSITAASTTIARALSPLLATAATALVGVEALTAGLIAVTLAAAVVAARVFLEPRATI